MLFYCPLGSSRGILKIMSYSLEFLDIDTDMKIARSKIPDRLVDFCKRSSVNRMAAGSRLPRSSHGIFSPSPTFSNTPYLTSLNRLYRTRSPTDLQHLCCKALIKKIIKKCE